MKHALVTALVAGTLATATMHSELRTTAGQSCESLASLTLPNATITLAQAVGSGSFIPPNPAGPAAAPPAPTPAFRDLPAFCRVAATLKPSSDSDIKVEVWMPTSGWNGKFQAVGNSGWAGAISYSAMADALKRGYATASIDTGHVGGTGAFALGHPEKYIDFGYRSPHEMAVLAKAIIAGHYLTAAKHSYWNGCSTGGRQGLMEAQRFPADFDGIIAGAPANPRSAVNALQLSFTQVLLKDDASFIPPAKYRLIHQAVVEACDALDGVKDDLIADPTRCHFDPRVLQCKGDEAPTCLTTAQVESARTLLSPARSRKTGEELFPGYEPGAELDLADPRAFGSKDAITRPVDHFKYVVFKDPNWDWRTFDLDRDLAKANEVDHGISNVTNPDLKKFAGNGGKLLMYHGWADGAVPPRASVNYYTSVVNTAGGLAKTGSWVRLFMVPGMHHCSGGEGPNTFDVVGALDQWVEQGTAPDQIVASHLTNGKIDRTRPLCPYPQVAEYKGTGTTDDATNFICKRR